MEKTIRRWKSIPAAKLDVEYSVTSLEPHHGTREWEDRI